MVTKEILHIDVGGADPRLLCQLYLWTIIFVYSSKAKIMLILHIDADAVTNEMLSTEMGGTDPRLLCQPYLWAIMEQRLHVLIERMVTNLR